ncbi:MAG: hypothetical protein ACAH83_05290 [Alphaproteobacteria bacterium]
MSQNPFHSAAAPDFRQMSASDLRAGVMVLSELARDLRRFRDTGDTRHLRLWAEGTKGAEAASRFFPGAALVMRIADMPSPVPREAAMLLGRNLVSDAEKLLRSYKDIWRARPGRSFHDIAARVKREKARPRWPRWAKPK